jgi:membrane-associated phospholipid phosphatase
LKNNTLKTLKDIINNNRYFYIINLLLLISCSLFLLTTTREDGFILLNTIHTPALTFFFEHITFLGDGAPILLSILAILLFSKKHKKLAIFLLISYIASGIFSQILKILILSPRPKYHFNIIHSKYYLDTFSNCRIGFRSFPSGHVSTAFGIATVLTNYFTKRYLLFFSFLYAILIGYSRIYLAHHFLIDVFAGILIGILCGTFAPLWYEKIVKLKFWKSIRIFNNFFESKTITNNKE